MLLALALLMAPAMPWGDAGAESPAADRQRGVMIRDQIRSRGISDPRVLAVMADVPRHRFVPRELQPSAYEDHPLPIGHGQTISQPYIVALMTQALGLSGTERVLEIGTGSGYQAAILSRLAAQVFTIEIVEPLCREARDRLRDLGYDNVQTRCGDGYQGWPEAAPFDGIMITAAVDHVPPALVDQLRDGGRMILPLGDPRSVQQLTRVTKSGNTTRLETILGVLFVPMTGRGLESPARR